MIELLVVIAVFAIWASLLLPALGQAKSKAHSTVCKSNLRQFGMALNLYVADYHAYPPEGGWPGGVWAFEYRYWFFNLNDYLGQRFARKGNSGWLDQTWACPGNKASGVLPISGSYGYNVSGASIHFDAIGGTYVAPGRLEPTRETEVRTPSDLLAMGDGFGIRSTNYATRSTRIYREHTPASDVRWSLPPNEITLARERHRGAINVVYCDGHVEGMKLEKLFFEESDQALRRWFRDNEPHRELLKHL